MLTTSGQCIAAKARIAGNMVTGGQAGGVRISVRWPFGSRK